MNVLLKKDVIDIERYSKDGRLTEVSDGKIYDYRAAFELIRKIGRPLTETEAEKFRIK
ncbi:MAG: hypothetical protein J6L69_07510 [Lachnospiraceae bacterium]|nr:hypothetical protein [Lachnospiraceae bacterium]